MKTRQAKRALLWRKDESESNETCYLFEIRNPFLRNSGLSNGATSCPLTIVYLCHHLFLLVPCLTTKYRVIRNDCRGFNNLSYTIHSRCNPMWFLSMGLRQGSGLCSSFSRKYNGTEGTNQNRHWNHHRWHATESLDWTQLSCWCFCRITKGSHIEHL